MITALLLENPDASADEAFEAHDVEIRRIPESLGEDDLIEALRGVQVLGIRSSTQVTERVLDNAPDLLAIGAFCIGTNQIDLAAAADRGIAVFNAPYSNTRSVVELAIAEIIALGRRLVERNNSLHSGVWNKSASHAHEVRGRTLGIIGYGSIGSQLSVLAEALGMKVIFYDNAEKLALGNAERKLTMEEVLREADTVSLHVSGDKENARLLGDREFAMMKDRAIFINLSRGFTVDIMALREHLASGHLAGAAVDVFPTEPKVNGDPFKSPLADMENVILTPHIGGSTVEAQIDIARFVSGKLCAYLERGATTMSVNLPNIALQPARGAAARLAFVHDNQPGVMAAMNQLFAEHGINVLSQTLATKDLIGYALMDIDGELPASAIEQVCGSPSTIRFTALPVTA